MRDQFYADSKDLWKWTVALREVQNRTGIIYVAMYRPDEPKRIPEDVHPDVKRFFREEWRVLDRERKCSRIEGLSKKITTFMEPYDARQASDYFSRLCHLLDRRLSDEKHLILLDPDTGIAENGSEHKHIRREHIAQLWSSMRSDDAVLVYQHNLGEKKDRREERLKSIVASALGRSLEHVKCDSCAGVCFFNATK